MCIQYSFVGSWYTTRNTDNSTIHPYAVIFIYFDNRRAFIQQSGSFQPWYLVLTTRHVVKYDTYCKFFFISLFTIGTYNVLNTKLLVIL